MKGVLQMDGYEKLMEQYDEAAFALMMDRSAEEEGAELLRMFREASDTGALPEYSDALDRRCRDSIEREFGKRTRRVRFRRFGQSLVRAAVVVFAMIGLAGTLIMSVEAWRAPVLSYIMESFGEYAELDFSNTPDQIKTEINPNDPFRPILPDGYQEVYYEVTDSLVCSMYENETANYIVFDMSRATGDYGFDTEDADVNQTTLEGYDALYITKDGRQQMIWIDEVKGIVFNLTADALSCDDFMHYCKVIAAHYR